MANFIPPQSRNIGSKANAEDMRNFLKRAKMIEDANPPIPSEETEEAEPVDQFQVQEDARKKADEAQFAPQVKFATEGKLEVPNSAAFFKKPKDIGNNPLRDFFRKPGMYIHLPSRGNFNSPEDLDFNITGEVAIYPMTSADEIIMKSPDALLNGDALAQVIKSCVPAVKNIQQLTSPDFNAIMLAVRSTSYGEQMDVSLKCPHCEHKNEYGFHIPTFLQTTGFLEEQYILSINGLKLHLNPYRYASIVKYAIVTFEQNKLIRTLLQEDVSDEEKLLTINESYGKVTEMKLDIMSNSISKIEVPDSEPVTDIEFIKEFLENIDAKNFRLIEETFGVINNTGVQAEVDVKCAKCAKDFKAPIVYDPANFFA